MLGFGDSICQDNATASLDGPIDLTRLDCACLDPLAVGCL